MEVKRLIGLMAIAGGVSFGAYAATPLSLSVVNWTLPESTDVWGLHFSPSAFVIPATNNQQ